MMLLFQINTLVEGGSNFQTFQESVVLTSLNERYQKLTQMLKCCKHDRRECALGVDIWR